MLRIIILFVLCYELSYAIPLTHVESAVLRTESPLAFTPAPVLNAIDDNSNDLNQLKRKLEIERTTAEIKKIRNGSAVEEKSDGAIQTVVTGVAISRGGLKIAWLRFADGGTLTVNLGSKVGKYIVSEIDQDGVTLDYLSSAKRKSTIYLHRVYPIAEHNRIDSMPKNPFVPSPIITGANAADKNEIVPPIVTYR